MWADATSVSLACSDFLTCSGLFDEPVLIHLTHSVASLPGANEAEADYLVTSSGGSSSSLTLKINNPVGPSKKSNWVGGRVEYTAAECGQSTCPFYLGNLSFNNDADVWDLYSDELLDDVDISNVEVRLRRPVLGVWRPSTGEIYLGDQMLDLRVEYEISVGSGTPTAIVEYVTNSGDVFGQIGAGVMGPSVEFGGISMVDGDFEAAATLDYDSPGGSPPTASFLLAPQVTLSPLESGLLVSSITNDSSDPDNDLDYNLWIVDGQQVAPGYVIPTGTHEVRLEVRDSRFAFDVYEQSVEISY